MEAALGHKAAVKRRINDNSPRLFDLGDPPEGELRAVRVVPSVQHCRTALSSQQTCVCPNPRRSIPCSCQVTQDRLGREDLSVWADSKGKRLDQRAITVECRKLFDQVIAIIQPTEPKRLKPKRSIRLVFSIEQIQPGEPSPLFQFVRIDPGAFGGEWVLTFVAKTDNRRGQPPLTDRLMELFRKDKGLIDALLPELTGEEAAATFGQNPLVPVYKALRYMVLREFTTGVRRTDCLESMGLAQVVYSGVNVASKGVRELATTLGISPEEAVEGVSLILDNWRRNRILYVNTDPIYSHFHAKDDPYIQAGLLPLREFRPEGLLLRS